MTQSSDIESLFRKFGGNAENYQEIGRETDSKAASDRWPVLGTIHLSQAAALPPVETGSSHTTHLPVVQPRMSRFAAPVIPPVQSAHSSVTSESLRFASAQEPAPVSEPRQAAPVAPPAVPAPALSRFGPPASVAPAAAPQPVAESTSILGRLFGAPAAAPVAAPAPAAAPDSLPALFDRLRGAPDPAAPSAPEPVSPPGTHWLTRGPRRP